MTTLVSAALLGIVVVTIAWPLLRRTPDRSPCKNVVPGAHDRLVYRDQLAELDQEIASGLITAAEAGATRVEIQRRLLAAARMAVPDTPPPRRNPILAGLVALVLAGGSVSLYSRLGQPWLADATFAPAAHAADPDAPAAHAADPNATPGHGVLREALARLARTLTGEPGNVDGWFLYARTAGSLGQWDQAVGAYRHLIDMGQDGADAQSGLGEMLVLQSNGIVTPAARDAFAAALKQHPANDVARYYVALADAQAGLPDRAIGQFQALLASVPEDSPMRQAIAGRVQEAARAAGHAMPELAKGTPAEPADAAAAASNDPPNEEQKTMIAGMVAQLADRLRDQPGDYDGWLRLGRAYAVMGNADAAADAYDRAATLKPRDIEPRLRAVEALLTGLKPGDALPPRAVTLLHQIERAAPDEPAVLWYLGVDAARGARPGVARTYWTRLIARLPPDAEDTRMVRAALGQLKGG